MMLPDMFQDHYSVHGENALFIATTFYKTLAVVKHIGGSENGLPGKGPTICGTASHISESACVQWHQFYIHITLP
jgi:hypothetical protein